MRRALISACAMSMMVLSIPSAVHCAESDAVAVLLDAADGWRVTFDSKDSVLECRHKPSGTTLAGPVTFRASEEGKEAEWSVQRSRDTAERRLALVDTNNDAQGYVAIRADAGRLTLAVVHRPPHTYRGVFCFAPTIEFGAQAFACRTRFDDDSPVVQMASGPADSRLNDSLFDADRDLLVQFGGENVAITTSESNGAMRFQADLTAAISKPNASAVTIDVLPDYYRERYVPFYRRIDRKRCPKPPTGWMAWNIYFDPATEDDNLAEARVGAKFLKPYGLEFWSIESWQEKSPELPVCDFHNLTLKASTEEFPHGMKWMADQIRALGLRPGIWTVSFGTGDETFYQEHRDWFLHDAEGRPMQNWSGRYLLDPSLPAVRKFTEETHRVISQDWGYEFFKTDGMSGRGPSLSAHFFERPEVRAAFQQPCDNPFGPWIEAIRRGIGPDRVLLACQGHYTGSEVAYCDASRTGGDVVHFPNPPDWSSYERQAVATQSQIFVNNILWYTDPDTLMVGPYASLDAARVATTIVALPGQLTFFGDKLGELAPERMRLLQQTLPVCDVHPMDLAPLDDLRPVWDLKVRRPFGSWDVVSLFNWSDKPAKLGFQFGQLGLDPDRDYLVYDFWNQKFLGSRKEGFEADLAPRSNILLAIHARQDRPQFLSTNRHVSQGGVELLDSTWNGGKNELTNTFDMVENDLLTATFSVPPSYVFEKATAEEANVVSATAEGATVSVSLRSAGSGMATLRLMFEKAN